MATDQKVGGSNPLAHAVKQKGDAKSISFFVLEAGADDTNTGSYLRSAPVGAGPRSPGPCAVSAPLRSAQDQDPLDLVRPLAHVIGKA